ncbi:MAG: glycosyl hydrolase [Acidobacteriota bacterium]|nr:glycosyl hydrolase [Blastocatellia bacterium]MDW8241393.1 glycosyl hydrolase [Acidobacteriota bacterium]
MLGRVKLFMFIAVLAVAPCSTLAQAETPKQETIGYDSETFAGLDARNIGPAVMSGRIAALDAIVEKGRLTIYVGSASGGVWKSVNGGTTFKPVFDKHTQSIGAVAIDRRNPKIVWVGTGESWVRNSVSVGTGVYKTTDGGETWQFVGLKDSERIASIVIDPNDSQTVYVAATGALWNAHPERGVFKTSDGGKTWKKVLYVNEDTGCASLAIDPQDGKILYAAMWQFRRKAYTFTSGGPGSGLYKSVDGGETWRKLTKGLPEGDLGRIGIAVAPSRPSVLYAAVEAKQSGFFRSDDLGETWTRVNSGQNVIGRPFYFAYVVVDPNDYNRVYKPDFSLAVSNDGGKTFSTIGGSVHSDWHALWVNPANSDHLIAGTDGGLYISEDRGNHWRFVQNLPLSQFYRVSYDMQQPYNVYGGLQDNSSWYGPSRAISGIQNRHWRSVYGGDGFWVFVDPTDEDYIYAEYQGGQLARINRHTLETKRIKPLPEAGEPKFRFNWNAPIHFSQHQRGTLYFGAQYLFRSKDRGDSWERISPDLTTNDPEKQKQEESGGLTIDNSTAENHCTIYTISESPRNGNIIWVGTDDGNLQITRDGGKTWRNVVGNVPGLPPHTWVSWVEASRFDEATAYATFDGHMNGDMKTYVYKTTDYGATWQSLTSGELSGYAHVIREDLVVKGLLFLGTEFGLFISLDGGRQWARFTGGNFPPVAVRDIAIHPRESDLILATHGRGIWIIDDITPLRALTPELLAQEATFVDARPSVMTIPASEFGFYGDAEFTGRSAPENAVITYYQKKRHIFGDLKFEIYDSSGRLISTIAGNKRRGLNRVEWPMRLKPPKVPPAAGLVPNFFSLVGPRVLDGVYTVKMIKDKQTYTTQLTLVPDPRSTHSREDRLAQYELVMKLYDLLGRLTYVVETITQAREQARERANKLPATDPLRKRLEELTKSVEAIRAKLVATREGGGITGEQKLRERLGDLYGNVNGYEGRPTQSQVRHAAALEKELDAVVAEFDAVITKELLPINAALEKKKLDPIKLMTKAEWENQQEK